MFLCTESFHFSLFLLFLGTDVWLCPLPTDSQCSPPPAIANGRHSGQALAVFTSGTSVSYTCDPGYVLVGEAHLNCTSAGAWSAPAPRCQGALFTPGPGSDTKGLGENLIKLMDSVLK